MIYIDPQSYNNLAMYDYELLSRLQRNDIIYCCSRKYDYLPLPQVEMRPLFRYNDYHLPVCKAVSYAWSMLRILWLCWRRRPTVVHVQWIRLWPIDKIVYRIIQRTIGCRIVYTAHNLLPHNAIHSDRRRYERLYHMVDNIIVHTKTSKHALMEQFGVDANKITIAPHGCLHMQSSLEDIQTCRKQLLLDYPKLNANLIFSLLGTQSAYKGTDILLEAWNNSSLANTPGIALLVAGHHQHPYKGPLADNVVLLDRHLSNVEFHTMLKLTNVLVLPYRAIDQSGLLLSAIAERIPFAVTSVGELTAPLEYGNVGWKIGQPNAENIASLLESLAAHPDMIQQCKNTNDWSCVQQLYSWVHSAQITNSVYGF